MRKEPVTFFAGQSCFGSVGNANVRLESGMSSRRVWAVWHANYRDAPKV